MKEKDGEKLFDQPSSATDTTVPAPDDLCFEDMFDLEEIQDLQDLFAGTMGVACQILRPDGTFITRRSNYCRLCGEIVRGSSAGLADCTGSDKFLGELTPEGLNIYYCKGTGLLEAGVPIIIEGRHVATWGMGQVSDGTRTEKDIRAYACEIGASPDDAAAAFKEVTVMTRERFQEVALMMKAFVKQLTVTGYQNLLQSRLIQEQKQTENELARYRWLMDKRDEPDQVSQRAYTPPYSDVTELNTGRLILDSVGKELLGSMVRDLMDLLDTSVAVYEVNGDYACGIFNSSWCRIFDSASFRLCGTDDVSAALNSGKWICHECCWNESARAAMESGEPSDIQCAGGIRLYAVPIRADGDIVGVLNIGYGNPPVDTDRLKELADRFKLDLNDVTQASAEYRPRPQYIIEVAKRRCRSIALHIGEIVQRKRIQEELKEKEIRLTALMSNLPGIAYRSPNRPGWPVAYLSEGCYEITGYTPSELGEEGSPSYGDIIHPDDLQMVCDTVEKSLLIN